MARRLSTQTLGRAALYQSDDALAQRMLDDRRFAFSLIVAGGDQQTEAGQPRLTLHRLQLLRKDRVK